MGVQYITLVFLASLALLFVLWRLRLMSSTTGAKILVFLFVAFVALLSSVSGKVGSKKYLMHYTSIPFLISVTMIVTKSAAWAALQLSLFIALTIGFKFELLPVATAPWYCVECLEQVALS